MFTAALFLFSGDIYINAERRHSCCSFFLLFSPSFVAVSIHKYNLLLKGHEIMKLFTCDINMILGNVSPQTELPAVHGREGLQSSFSGF